MALSTDELAVKASKMELTVGEAIDYALELPGVSDNKKKQIRALKSGLPKAGINLDLPYTEMRRQENWSLLSKEVGGANRYGNFQSLESSVRPVLQAEGVLNLNIETPDGRTLEAYPLIVGGKGSGSLSGGSQRTGLAGERPMQGLIPEVALNQIYQEALPKVVENYDQPTADLIEYHKATFQRPEQLIGDSAILKSDVSVKDGVVTIKGLRKGNKSRPTVTFPAESPVGALVIRNLETGEGEKLFDTTPAKFDSAFRETISPSLLGAFEDVLPLYDANDPSRGVVSTPSAIRSAMTRILGVEKGYPDDIVEAMMGHIDASILTRNYRGAKPAKGMGDIITGLYLGDTPSYAGFGGEGGGIVLTPEQQKSVAEAQVSEAQAKRDQSALDSLNARKERIQFLQSPEGQEFLRQEEEYLLSEAERQARIKARQDELKAETRKAQRDAQKAAEETERAEALKMDSERSQKFLKAISRITGKKYEAASGLVGLGLSYLGITERLSEKETDEVDTRDVLGASMRELTAPGLVIDIAESGGEIVESAGEFLLSPFTEAAEEEAEEKGLAGDTEAQVRSVFGIPPSQ